MEDSIQRITLRFQPSLPALSPKPGNSFNAFWTLPISTGASFRATAPVQPLSQLLLSTKAAFSWRPSEAQAFEGLKTLFTTAPIPQLLDPDRQFVVEVDASDTGVGAILSQRPASDQKLHPCVFFSLRLTPAEQNYDIGNYWQ